jgi:hypothetical protein
MIPGPPEDLIKKKQPFISFSQEPLPNDPINSPLNVLLRKQPEYGPPSNYENPGTDPLRNLTLWHYNQESDPEFQNLPYAEKLKRRKEYFDNYVLPNAADPTIRSYAKSEMFPGFIGGISQGVSRAMSQLYPGFEPSTSLAGSISQQRAATAPTGRGFPVAAGQVLGHLPTFAAFQAIGGEVIPLLGLAPKITSLMESAFTFGGPAAFEASPTGEPLGYLENIGTSAALGVAGFGPRNILLGTLGGAGVGAGQALLYKQNLLQGALQGGLSTFGMRALGAAPRAWIGARVRAKNLRALDALKAATAEPLPGETPYPGTPPPPLSAMVDANATAEEMAKMSPLELAKTQELKDDAASLGKNALTAAIRERTAVQAKTAAYGLTAEWQNYDGVYNTFAKAMESGTEADRVKAFGDLQNATLLVEQRAGALLPEDKAFGDSTIKLTGHGKSQVELGKVAPTDARLLRQIEQYPPSLSPASISNVSDIVDPKTGVSPLDTYVARQMLGPSGIHAPDDLWDALGFPPSDPTNPAQATQARIMELASTVHTLRGNGYLVLTHLGPTVTATKLRVGPANMVARLGEARTAIGIKPVEVAPEVRELAKFVEDLENDPRIPANIKERGKAIAYAEIARRKMPVSVPELTPEGLPIKGAQWTKGVGFEYMQKLKEMRAKGINPLTGKPWEPAGGAAPPTEGAPPAPITPPIASAVPEPGVPEGYRLVTAQEMDARNTMLSQVTKTIADMNKEGVPIPPSFQEQMVGPTPIEMQINGRWRYVVPLDVSSELSKIATTVPLGNTGRIITNPQDAMNVNGVPVPGTIGAFVLHPEPRTMVAQLIKYVQENEPLPNVAEKLVNNIYNKLTEFASEDPMVTGSTNDQIRFVQRLGNETLDILKHVEGAPYSPLNANPIELMEAFQRRGIRGRVNFYTGEMSAELVPNSNNFERISMADLRHIPELGSITTAPAKGVIVAEDGQYWITRSKNGYNVVKRTGKIPKTTYLSSEDMRDFRDILYSSHGYNLESITNEGDAVVRDLSTGEAKLTPADEVAKLIDSPGKVIDYTPDFNGEPVAASYDAEATLRNGYDDSPPVPMPKEAEDLWAQEEASIAAKTARIKIPPEGTGGGFSGSPAFMGLSPDTMAAVRKFKAYATGIGHAIDDWILDVDRMFARVDKELGKFGVPIYDAYKQFRDADIHAIAAQIEHQSKVYKLIKDIDRAEHPEGIKRYVRADSLEGRAQVVLNENLNDTDINLAGRFEDVMRTCLGKNWGPVFREDIPEYLSTGKIPSRLRDLMKRGGFVPPINDASDKLSYVLANAFATRLRLTLSDGAVAMNTVKEYIKNAPLQRTPDMPPDALIMPGHLKATVLELIHNFETHTYASLSPDRAAGETFLRKAYDNMGLTVSEDFFSKVLPRLMLYSYTGTLPLRFSIIIKHAMQPITVGYPMFGAENMSGGLARSFLPEGETLCERIGIGTYSNVPQSNLLQERGLVRRLWNNGMKPLNVVMEHTRGWMANVGAYAIEKNAPELIRGDISPREFFRKTGLVYTEEAVRNFVIKPLLENGTEGVPVAAERMATVANERSMWLYRNNSAKLFNTKVGRFLGQMSTWPTNYLHYMIRGVFNGDPIAGAIFAARWGVANEAVREAGRQVFGIDPTAWLFLGPLHYAGGPNASTLADLRDAFAGSDYEKPQALARLKADLMNFIPLHGMYADWDKALHEKTIPGALKRIAGMRPYEH